MTYQLQSIIVIILEKRGIEVNKRVCSSDHKLLCWS